MANNAAHNTATTVIGNRATPDVSLNVAAVAAGSALSGGTDAFSWSAADGLVNGKELVVSTTGSFGTGPTKQIVMGFGQGFLYDNSVGTSLSSHTDALSNEDWSYSAVYGAKKVVLENGIRALLTDESNENSSGSLVPGFHGWDAGANLANDEKLFISRLTKARATAVGVGGSTSQYKEVRLSDQNGFGTNGDNYLKINPGNLSHSTGGGVWTLESDSNTLYSGPGPAMGDKWARLDNIIEMGTLGTDDGSVIGTTISPGTDSVIRNDDYIFSSGATSKSAIMHSSGMRTRWVLFQEYFSYGTEVEIFVSDYLIQIGSFARVELADTDDPSTTTEAYILPVKSWSTSTVTLHLWKAFFSSFTGKFLHFYDEDNVFQRSVEVTT